jgi:hypothetical protein
VFQHISVDPVRIELKRFGQSVWSVVDFDGMLANPLIYLFLSGKLVSINDSGGLDSSFLSALGLAL